MNNVNDQTNECANSRWVGKWLTNSKKKTHVNKNQNKKPCARYYYWRHCLSPLLVTSNELCGEKTRGKEKIKDSLSGWEEMLLGRKSFWVMSCVCFCACPTSFVCVCEGLLFCSFGCLSICPFVGLIVSLFVWLWIYLSVCLFNKTKITKINKYKIDEKFQPYFCCVYFKIRS